MTDVESCQRWPVLGDDWREQQRLTSRALACRCLPDGKSQFRGESGAEGPSAEAQWYDVTDVVGRGNERRMTSVVVPHVHFPPMSP
jgi:hypothetical protein